MRRRGRTSGAYLLRIGRGWARFRGWTAPAVDAERYATETVSLANGSRIDFARGPGERFLAASYGYHWTPDQATADAPPKQYDHAPDVARLGHVLAAAGEPLPSMPVTEGGWDDDDD
jgi:hypothetical protein